MAQERRDSRGADGGAAARPRPGKGRTRHDDRRQARWRAARRYRKVDRRRQAPAPRSGSVSPYAGQRGAGAESQPTRRWEDRPDHLNEVWAAPPIPEVAGVYGSSTFGIQRPFADFETRAYRCFPSFSTYIQRVVVLARAIVSSNVLILDFGGN